VYSTPGVDDRWRRAGDDNPLVTPGGAIMVDYMSCQRRAPSARASSAIGSACDRPVSVSSSCGYRTPALRDLSKNVGDRAALRLGTSALRAR
jgi:hypothetical protein